MNPLAETWECSTHPDGPSTIASGPYQGMLLTDYLKAYPESMGTHPRKVSPAEGQLPIMIKFIDAARDLSVQVHPDDVFAAEFENGSLGKTEMWYVLDAAEDARLVYGFNRDVDEETVRHALQNDTIGKLLRFVQIHKDEVYFIESGTVHAIGAGSLIVEVQENSNITYRLYDYHRKDRNGKERPLHVDKAMRTANFKSSFSPRQPLRVLRFRQGWAEELLCRCRYFQVSRVMINTEDQTAALIQTDQVSFIVLVCTDGDGVMDWNGGEKIRLRKGDTVFLPADGPEIRIHGQANFLKVRC